MQALLKKIKIRTAALWCLNLNALFVFANPDSFLGIADYYIYILAFFVFFILLKKVPEKNMTTYIIIAMMAYNTIAMLIALSQNVVSTGYILSYYVYLLLALFMYTMDFDKKEIKSLLSFYILSAIVICLIMFIQRIDFYGIGDMRHTIKIFNNEIMDPNFLAAFLVFPAIISFSKMMYKFDAKSIISTIIIILGILYTSSRGAMLSTAIGAIFSLVGYFKDKKNKIRLIEIIVLGVIAIILFIIIIPSNSLSRLFDFASYKDASNGKRMVDWAAGLEAFAKRPIFGYGLQGEMTIIQNALGINYISHNTYIALLMQFGAVGFLIPAFGVGKMIWTVRKNPVLLGCIFSTLAVVFFVSAEVSLFLWLPLIYILVIAKFEKEKDAVNLWLQ